MIDQSAYCLSPNLSPSLSRNLHKYQFGNFTLNLELSPIPMRPELDDYIQYMDECEYEIKVPGPEKIDLVIWLKPGSRTAFTLVKHKTLV